jgi:radical SAM enzyme (TIGR01210 family)
MIMTGDGTPGAELSLREFAANIYMECGPAKSMTSIGQEPDRPHYFLVRQFLDVIDLLVIFNTKRCRYQCHFCDLPSKSTRNTVSDTQIEAQFRHVLSEVRHSVGLIGKVTLSNEGSVLDETTFGRAALTSIVCALPRLRYVRRVDLETRIEFVTERAMAELAEAAPSLRFGVLTGFETLDRRIRDVVLRKREPLDLFLAGLDNVQKAGADLTCYVLFKPDPAMTDEAAIIEANESIKFLVLECGQRGIDLTIRLNPMYRAENTRWAARARATPGYQPPRLSHVIELAEDYRRRGTPVYIGLSTEGLSSDDGAYPARSDFNRELLRRAKALNRAAPTLGEMARIGVNS